jgi:conjugal transfer/entry exclusion protein
VRKKALATLLVAVLCVGTASAQFGFGGIVYDPTNYANAVLRYQQLVQQLAQLRQTYQQVLNQYNLALQMSRNLHNMPARYRAQFSNWRSVTATNTYGNTGGWLGGVNSDLNTINGYLRATTQLGLYNPSAIASMPDYEQARVKSQYASVELADGANMNALSTIGAIRGNAATLEARMNNLEQDSLSDDMGLNSEVSVLNKINATNVLTLRSIQDTNKLLASLLEQQTIAAKQQREMTTNAINAEISRQLSLTTNLAQVTGTLNNSLQNFRIP